MKPARELLKNAFRPKTRERILGSGCLAIRLAFHPALIYVDHVDDR